MTLLIESLHAVSWRKHTVLAVGFTSLLALLVPFLMGAGLR
jgi:hypothetical protein